MLSKEHYKSYQGYKELIEEISILPFYMYEQNRKIKEIKYLHIKETNEVIEVNPELIKKYDITNKSIELINSGYKDVPSDPYLAACIKAFQFNITNINHIEEQVLRRYIIWKELEDKRYRHLIILLGPKANESNYIELQKIELDKYYKLIDKCRANYNYSYSITI